MKCIYCETELPNLGFFCPNCFKQVKCKHCSEVLLNGAKICVYCGKEIGNQSSISNINTIEFRETETERNFKASFTDTVGESVSESFGLFMAKKVEFNKGLPPKQNQSFDEIPDTEDAESTVESNSEISKNDIPNNSSIDIPTLKDVKLRDLAKNETDLFLVYVFYATDGGKKEFTRNSLVDVFKSQDMYTIQRRKNLSIYFKNTSKALYIKSTNETDFILLDKGKDKVFEIFKGNSQSTKRKTSLSTSGSSKKEKKIKEGEDKTKGKKASSIIDFIDLKLTIKEQESLSDFYNTKKPSSQNEKVLVVIKWYIDLKKIKEISIEEINYLLSIVSERPAALNQVLINMAGANFRWLVKENEKYKLSSIGTGYINKLPK